MSNLKKFRVFIEYIHPSKRDLTAQKGWWDIGSVVNGWRHARLIVTTKPVPFISSDVKGDVYDAGKDDKSRLIPIYDKFQPTPYNRYLPIGSLKETIDDDKIKAFLDEFVKKNPNYDLLRNNCEDLAQALASQIIDGLYPTQVKTKGAVYPLTLGDVTEHLVKIIVKDSFQDAVIYDPKATLAKGPGPFNIDDIIKEEK